MRPNTFRSVLSGRPGPIKSNDCWMLLHDCRFDFDVGLSKDFRRIRAEIMNLPINGRIISLIEGDITKQNTDAIVNAANSQLILGAGVAGAIRNAGGPSIQEECNRIGGCQVGNAVITTGGNLSAKHVIHAVGPRMGEGEEEVKLRQATQNGLRVAEENGLTSIAFPAISTGIFGFPLQRCSEIMLGVALDHFEKETTLELIVFCLFGQEAHDVFKNTLEDLFRHRA